MVRTNAAARAHRGDGSIVRQGGPVKIEASGCNGSPVQVPNDRTGCGSFTGVDRGRGVSLLGRPVSLLRERMLISEGLSPV